MLRIRYSSRFKKDFKAVVKRGYDVKLLEEVLNLLIKEKTLPRKYLDHPLASDYAGHRECHITPDWLLIYKIELHVKPNQIKVDPPVCRFSPWPAEAGWIRATGSSPPTDKTCKSAPP